MDPPFYPIQMSPDHRTGFLLVLITISYMLLSVLCFRTNMSKMTMNYTKSYILFNNLTLEPCMHDIGLHA